MEFFDTHTHLNDEQLAPNIEELLRRAAAADVRHMAVVGYDWKSSVFAVHLAEKYAPLVPVVGIHPHDAETLNDSMFMKLADLAALPVVRAVGEIGLDYYRDLSPRETQKKAFMQQIDLARQLQKPIVIHDRDAHGDMLDILKKEMPGVSGGIMHCYSGSWEMAQECLKLGFEISFAGPVTYTNAKQLAEVAAKVPLEHLLIETDCPYLSPHPFRGQTNEPARVELVAQKVAELHNISLYEAGEITTANAKRIYGIE